MTIPFAAKAEAVMVAIVAGVLAGLAFDQPVFVDQPCMALDAPVCHAWLLDGTVVRLVLLAGVPLGLGLAAAAATRDWTMLLFAGACAALAMGFTLGAGAADRAAYDDSRQVVLGMFFVGGAVAAVPGLAVTAAVWAGVGAARDRRAAQ